jgi:hypothetical protein
LDLVEPGFQNLGDDSHLIHGVGRRPTFLPLSRRHFHEYRDLPDVRSVIYKRFSEKLAWNDVQCGFHNWQDDAEIELDLHSSCKSILRRDDDCSTTQTN